MTSNILDAPVSKLQSILEPPAPWGFVARHLVCLLKSYSTGLSFQVAADEISLAWRNHCRATKPRPRTFTGTITHVALGPPEVWLVRFADATEVAVYAHSNYFGIFKPGCVISISVDCIIQPDAPQGVIPEQVRLVRQALRHAFSGTSHEVNPIQTPITKIKGTSSQSPVDVMKFSTKNPQPQNAATPSQAIGFADPGGTVSRIVMPTSKLFFDLTSVNCSSLGLDETPQAFTLQRVWNERSLTPNWIYAVVVQLELGEEYRVRLQDVATHDGDEDQPSVLWRLSEDLKSITGILESGFHVLIKNPTVQPTSDSFEIICTPHTTCFYVPKSNNKHSDTSGRLALQDITNTGSRNLKRRRTDSKLSGVTTTVTTREVSRLVSPECQEEFVAHTRVTSRAVRQSAYLTVLACGDDVTVTIIGTGMGRRALQAAVGDEILLQGMTYAKQSVSGDEMVPCGWIATSVDNLSTMSGVLFSPIVRHLMPLKHYLAAESRASITYPATFHALGRIQNAFSKPETREVFLTITDFNQVATSSLTQAIASGAKQRDVDSTQERATHDGIQARDMEWNVRVRNTCFESLFCSQRSASSSDDDTGIPLAAALPRIRATAWMMTLTLYSPRESRSPEVCACAPCTRSLEFF